MRLLIDDQLPGATEFTERRSRRALLEKLTKLKVHASDGVMKLGGLIGGKMRGRVTFKSVAGRAFHALAISEVVFSPPKNNTPHWFENPHIITLTHYITII